MDVLGMKELEKRMQTLVSQSLEFTKKPVAGVEKNLKEYVDKQVAARKADTDEVAKEVMGFTKTTAGAVEKSLAEHIKKTVADLKKANNLK